MMKYEITWNDITNPPKDFGTYLVVYVDGTINTIEFWPPKYWGTLRPISMWAEINSKELLEAMKPQPASMAS